MIPVIALVGRPNVGKSTLFNRLTRSRDALVANYSGLTRDRKYGDGEMFDRRFMVIDTGGISGEEEGIAEGPGQGAEAGHAEGRGQGVEPREGRRPRVCVARARE